MAITSVTIWTKRNVCEQNQIYSFQVDITRPFFQQSDLYAFQDILYQELFVIKTNRIFKFNSGTFIIR